MRLSTREMARQYNLLYSPTLEGTTKKPIASTAKARRRRFLEIFNYTIRSRNASKLFEKNLLIKRSSIERKIYKISKLSKTKIQFAIQRCEYLSFKNNHTYFPFNRIYLKKKPLKTSLKLRKKRKKKNSLLIKITLPRQRTGSSHPPEITLSLASLKIFHQPVSGPRLEVTIDATYIVLLIHPLQPGPRGSKV